MVRLVLGEAGERRYATIREVAIGTRFDLQFDRLARIAQQRLRVSSLVRSYNFTQ